MLDAWKLVAQAYVCRNGLCKATCCTNASLPRDTKSQGRCMFIRWRPVCFASLSGRRIVLQRKQCWLALARAGRRWAFLFSCSDVSPRRRCCGLPPTIWWMVVALEAHSPAAQRGEAQMATSCMRNPISERAGIFGIEWIQKLPPLQSAAPR